MDKEVMKNIRVIKEMLRVVEVLGKEHINISKAKVLLSSGVMHIPESRRLRDLINE